MSGFSKLHTSLLTSSIWDESDHVRIVWITLLSMVEDSGGFVNSSLPGLAHMARKTREETLAALAVLEAPDPDSKNPDNEGRRIKKVEGGWLVLNYEIYRATKEELSVDPNTVASRERMRRYRERKSLERNSNVTTVTGVTSASASASASASDKKGETEGKGKMVYPAGAADEFKAVFGRWMAFRKANGKKIKDWDELFQAQLAWIAKQPEGDWIEICEHSIRNGYQGLFSPKRNGTVPVKGKSPADPQGWTEFIKSKSRTDDFRHAPEYLRIEFAQCRKNQSS